jgi:hypothetical protein
MMGVAAFRPLNAGFSGVESLQRAKMSVARLPTSLGIGADIEFGKVSKMLHAEVLWGRISAEYG